MAKRYIPPKGIVKKPPSTKHGRHKFTHGDFAILRHREGPFHGVVHFVEGGWFYVVRNPRHSKDMRIPLSDIKQGNLKPESA